MSGPNWEKLFREGRVKAVGVPWSEDELHALYQLGIPVEYVRSGILDVEEYKKAKAKDEKDGRPLERLPRHELVGKAQELGVEFLPNTPDYVLIEEIRRRDKKPAKKKVAKKTTKKSTRKRSSKTTKKK